MNGVGTLRWRGRAACLVLGGALVAAVAGCGSDGIAKVAPRGECEVQEGEPIPEGCLPEQVARVTGVVFAPDGIYARSSSTGWFASLNLVARAHAWFSFLEPVGIGVEVSLLEVTELDAADGSIDNPIPVGQWAVTNADGVYAFHDPASDKIERCRLMVSVGSDRAGNLTRAFAHSQQVNIDPASEAVVRLVLRRIVSTRIQLCDFDPEGLRAIVREAELAASQVSGGSVQDVNDQAFEFVRRDCDVLRLVEAVTQVSFDPPIRETDRGDCEVLL